MAAHHKKESGMPHGEGLTERVRAFALKLGFDAVGIARADRELGEDIARYDAFVEAGMQGEMGWLAKHREARARLDGDQILAGAKSVVCLARSYGSYERAPVVADPGVGLDPRHKPEMGRDPRHKPEMGLDPRHKPDMGRDPRHKPENGELAGGIARYARGRDYHRFLRRGVRRLAAFLRTLGSADCPVRARPLCDDAPILERAWAAQAGLGFVGKNGMLIVPGVGSMVLLGEVVTTLELSTGAPMTQRCGACTRCLDACPTGAFRTPFVLDPRRCVSYLTIEHRSAVPVGLREAVGENLFGCDDCQTVCPFNANALGGLGRGGAFGGGAPNNKPGGPFAPLERWSRVRLEDLLAMDQAQWLALSEGTPLKRAGRCGLARNAAIVLGNRRDRRALAALRQAANGHEEPVVREAAAWAIARIEKDHSACAVPFVEAATGARSLSRSGARTPPSDE
ncbi:MAG TPA: tRNA epoxyqueuosine(34) reductase QueG [Polyangiaceae bacterium]|jgi:epoxyqueuosine reductase|nr:tRNA epoxyqueuosine(34) reductase QueG [Polyangiaceae bacterium]